MGSMSVSSCRCCVFLSCVYTVSVLNTALCMTCSLLILVEDAIGSIRHSLQAVKLSQTAVQIVSNPPSPIYITQIIRLVMPDPGFEPRTVHS